MGTMAPPNLDWAKNYVATLNEEQLSMLKNMYAQHRANTAAQEEQRKAEEIKEKERAQQQAILDLLTSQKPITVDVVRSSTSPESFTSSNEAADNVTVKDVLLGKVKSSYRSSSPRVDIKPYKPRGSRERILFEDYLFTFDKLSYDCKKRFFRCERKSSCPARVHTPIDSDRVIHRAQNHNHPPPAPYDLTNYDFDSSKIRQGYVMHVNPIQNRSSVPPSILTPKSDIEEENWTPKMGVSELPRTIKTESSTSSINGDILPVTRCVPENFHQPSDAEKRNMEFALTRFLMHHSELRKELLSRKEVLPTICPQSTGSQLTLFVANQSDDVFHMVLVKERNERSIRDALQEHFNQKTARALQINIATRINLPLSQQMIDGWKTEEFLRVDISKPTAWKIHRVTKPE